MWLTYLVLKRKTRSQKLHLQAGSLTCLSHIVPFLSCHFNLFMILMAQLKRDTSCFECLSPLRSFQYSLFQVQNINFYGLKIILDVFFVAFPRLVLKMLSILVVYRRTHVAVIKKLLYLYIQPYSKSFRHTMVSQRSRSTCKFSVRISRNRSSSSRWSYPLYFLASLYLVHGHVMHCFTLSVIWKTNR